MFKLAGPVAGSIPFVLGQSPAGEREPELPAPPASWEDLLLFCQDETNLRGSSRDALILASGHGVRHVFLADERAEITRVKQRPAGALRASASEEPLRLVKASEEAKRSDAMGFIRGSKYCLG